MGTWGAGNFENDDAKDWVYELEKADEESVILEALNIVAKQGDEYLEAYDSYRVLVAAEVVSALKNHDSSDLPDEVKQWVSKHQKIEIPALTQLAMNAVQRIKTNSGLKELWDESDSAAKWNEIINNLNARLS